MGPVCQDSSHDEVEVSRARVNEVKSCQILYFLPILSKVKIAFTIFKLKLLEWCSAEEQETLITTVYCLSKAFP